MPHGLNGGECPAYDKDYSPAGGHPFCYAEGVDGATFTGKCRCTGMIGNEGHGWAMGAPRYCKGDHPDCGQFEDTKDAMQCWELSDEGIKWKQDRVADDDNDQYDNDFRCEVVESGMPDRCDCMTCGGTRVVGTHTDGEEYHYCNSKDTMNHNQWHGNACANDRDHKPQPTSGNRWPHPNCYAVGKGGTAFRGTCKCDDNVGTGQVRAMLRNNNL